MNKSSVFVLKKLFKSHEIIIKEIEDFLIQMPLEIRKDREKYIKQMALSARKVFGPYSHKFFG